MEEVQIIAKINSLTKAQENIKIIKIAFNSEQIRQEMKGLVLIPMQMTNRTQNLTHTQDQSGLNLNKKSIPNRKKREKTPIK